jgi:hypothetical protein
MEAREGSLLNLTKEIVMTTLVRKKLVAPKYVKYSQLKAGDVVAIGIFIGTEQVDNFTRTAKVPQHTIQDTETGAITKLPSAGQLNWAMSQLEAGTMVEVIFLGKEKFKNKQGLMVDSNQFEINTFSESEEG